MVKEHKDPLAKVDGGKRDFLKKMAIGTAYAVPVMTTFSLDGVRNTALAQGTYSPPEVTDFQAGPNRLEITFSRPMDAGSVGGSGVSGSALSCWQDSFGIPSSIGKWKWVSMYKRVFTAPGQCFSPRTARIYINEDGCFGDKVRDADGQVCKSATVSGTWSGNDCG